MLGRRALMVGAVAAAACSRSERAAGGEPPPPSMASMQVRLLEWDLGAQPWGQARAVIVVPNWASVEGRFPVVVALHGRGEALKAPADGAMGWPRDYALVRAVDRLRAPPLREADYEGFVEPAHLADQNESLRVRPFGGVIVACPWLPDIRPASTGDIAAYSRWIVEGLLPRVRRETPAFDAAEATGIDGVSLGGAVALRVGLTCPEAFGAVSAIQPAVDGAQAPAWTVLAEAARARRPQMKLRLVTSHDDYFHDSIVTLSSAWRAAGIAHDFAELPGPHDYVFNRGPGSIELLLWHDRALARR